MLYCPSSNGVETLYNRMVTSLNLMQPAPVLMRCLQYKTSILNSFSLNMNIDRIKVCVLCEYVLNDCRDADIVRSLWLVEEYFNKTLWPIGLVFIKLCNNCSLIFNDQGTLCWLSICINFCPHLFLAEPVLFVFQS